MPSSTGHLRCGNPKIEEQIAGSRRSVETPEIGDLFSGDLVAAQHQPSEQLANTTPNSRIDLDIERRTNEQHQKTCFQLFHRKHLPNSILDASSRQILVISFRRGCYKLRCSE